MITQIEKVPFTQLVKHKLQLGVPYKVEGDFDGLHVMRGAHRYNRVLVNGRENVDESVSAAGSRRLTHNGFTIAEPLRDPIFLNTESAPDNDDQLELLLLKSRVGYAVVDAHRDVGFRCVDVAERLISSGGTFTIAQDFAIEGPLEDRMLRSDWGYWSGTVWGTGGFSVVAFSVIDNFGAAELIPCWGGVSKAYTPGSPAHYFDLDASCVDTKFDGVTVTAPATIVDPALGRRVPLGLASRHLLRIVNTTGANQTYKWITGVRNQ